MSDIENTIKNYTDIKDFKSSSDVLSEYQKNIKENHDDTITNHDQKNKKLDDTKNDLQKDFDRISKNEKTNENLNEEINDEYLKICKSLDIKTTEDDLSDTAPIEMSNGFKKFLNKDTIIKESLEIIRNNNESEENINEAKRNIVLRYLSIQMEHQEKHIDKNEEKIFKTVKKQRK